MDEPDTVISEIITKMRNLGADVNCNKKNKKMPVNTIIPSERQIAALVKQIMKMYQKAVEYYSAIGRNEYIIYLNKIRDLIASKEKK